MQETVLEAVTLRCIGPDEFESVQPVEFNGPTSERIGYGGYCIAFGINAAAATRTVPQQSDFLVYSVTGYFAAFASTSENLKAQVSSVRDSRTFATRKVDLYQTRGGKNPLIMTMIVDFQRPEPVSMLTFSALPYKLYTTPEESLSEEDKMTRAIGSHAKESQKAHYKRMLMHMFRKFDRRTAAVVLVNSNSRRSSQSETPGPTPVYLASTQHEDRDITEQTYCHYYKHTKPVHDHLANVLSIAYLSDAGTPYIAPTFAGIDRKDIGAAANLDFALRILSNDLDLNQWTLREERTLAARDGRTYSETRIFNHKNEMIAQMSGQCTLRPRAVKKVVVGLKK